MKIVYTTTSKQNLLQIKQYITQDKKTAGAKFIKELKSSIENLINFPYKYKQSNYYENKEIRDMSFKGYSIIYRINNNNQTIEILEIFNRNLPQIEYKL
ncbi:MAG: type II toxin-antitoxin system RelE/ParE family toxin [Campylobacterota bacterium]|nr:type II toxin-antitoxin system RelE/ParE family toxin [Campylobacterota bacterium]